MKTVEIPVNDGFLVPDLSEISTDEWEIGIQTVVDFHSISRLSTSSNSNSEALQTVVSSKFTAKYDKLKQKLELATSLNDTYQHELESLTDKYNTSRREYINELDAEKKKMEDRHQLQIDKYNEQNKIYQEKIYKIQSELDNQNNKNQIELLIRINEEQDKLRNELNKEHKIKLNEIEQDLKYNREQLKTYQDKLNETQTLLDNQENKYQLDLLAKINEEREKLRTNLTKEYNIKINKIEQELESNREQIKTYQDKLNETQLELSEQKSQIKEHYKEQYEEKLEKTILTMKTNYQSQIEKTLSEQKDSFEKEIYYLKNVIENNKVLEELKTSINKVTGSGTNYEKGTAGEIFVQTILTSDRYLDAIIEDVSSDTAAGDLFFKWKQIKCLVEVKNKQRLTLDDMNKFIRDIKESESTSRINCAIFVSLLTDIFPGRTRLPIQFDTVYNIPVVYIYYTNPNDIHTSILYLDKLLSMCLTDDEQTQSLILGCKSYRKTLIELVDSINKTIKRREQELKYLKKQYITYTEELDNLEKTFDTNKLLLENSANKTTTEKLDTMFEKLEQEDLDEKKRKYYIDVNDADGSINTIKQLIIENNLNKVINTEESIIDQLNITKETLLKFGKFDDIYEMVKTEQIEKVVTENVIEQITNYMNENDGRFPLRDALIPAIIKRSIYEKLGKTLNIKPFTFIKAYYEQMTNNSSTTNNKNKEERNERELNLIKKKMRRHKKEKPVDEPTDDVGEIKLEDI